MAKIAYTNKVTASTIAAAEINKITAANMNEIKISVNVNVDDIAAEIINRASADTALQNNIDAEVTDRENAVLLKANVENPTFTGTVGGITKSMVGLGNVDNTSDANKPLTTPQANALALKLDKTSVNTAAFNVTDNVNPSSQKSTFDKFNPLIQANTISLSLKATLSVGKNLFNKNATKKTFVVAEESQIDTFGNQILVSCLKTGYDFGTFKLKYNEYVINLSPPYLISELIGNIKSNQVANTNVNVLYFNENNRIIKVETSDNLATWFVEPTNGTLTYVRFGYGAVNEATLQIEYGTASTVYEDYKLVLDADLIPNPTGEIVVGEFKAVAGYKIKEYVDGIIPEAPAVQDISNKANLENIQGKNLFNKALTKKVFVVDEEIQVDTLDDTILVNCLTTGYNYATFKLKYTSFGISLSPKIYLTDLNPKAKLNELITTQTAVLYFNASNRIIQKLNSTNLADKSLITDLTNGAVDYVRFSYTKNSEDTVQIEYGEVITTYEFYENGKYLKYSEIPKTVAKVEDVKGIVVSMVGVKPTLSLPSKLFFLKDVKSIVYLDSIINKHYRKLDTSISLTNTVITKIYNSLLIAESTTAQTVNNTISLNAYGKFLESKTISIEVVSKPSTAKVLNIWNTGDSITDLGTYQPEIKANLAIDNITANFIGLMPCGADPTIYADPLSGGNLSFISEKGTDAIVVDVTGITVLPKTGYPGTQYEDTNNNSWVVRGFKLTESGGTYSGKIKLGIFQIDPNYGTGGSSGTTPTAGFPVNSTLTKTNALPGDTAINYTTVDVVNFNPYWNPNTNEVDFSWYQTYWELTVPNVFLMQWSYNDIGSSYQEINGATITTAMARAKLVVDKFISQFPSAKIVFGTDPYGAELTGFNGSSNNEQNRKYGTLNFFQALVNTFDKASYLDKVYLIPTHAFFNHKYGYGSVMEEVPNANYPNLKIEKLVNGFDGVHPSLNTLGWKDEAAAYRAVFNKIANSL